MDQRPINILIVEDEELFASKMEMQIDKLNYTCVGIVDNRESAMGIVENTSIDLILMDINISGEYDGIELAQEIVSEYDIPILFITSNHDDMSFKRASRIGASGFIIKPFSDIQLQRSIELALKNQQLLKSNDVKYDGKIEANHLFIKKNKEILKVNIAEIFYLESDGRYCRIYTQADMFMVRKPMKELMSRLESQNFFQCHRSYAVNLNKVKSINTQDDLIIMEERSVPLSRREKDDLLEKLNYLN